MRLVFSRLAEKDLEEIGDYIAADNPARALRFVREIRRHCGEIATSPLAYVARPELGPQIRACPHGRYLIYFQALDDQIVIARVLAGARDLPRLFGSDEP